MAVKFRVSSHRDFNGFGHAVVIRHDSNAPTCFCASSRRGRSHALRALARVLGDLLADATRQADALEQEGQ